MRIPDSVSFALGAAGTDAGMTSHHAVITNGRVAASTKEDVEGVYNYFATGQLQPAITEIGFDEIPSGLEKLHHGEVVGRLVVTY